MSIPSGAADTADSRRVRFDDLAPRLPTIPRTRMRPSSWPMLLSSLRSAASLWARRGGRRPLLHIHRLHATPPDLLPQRARYPPKRPVPPPHREQLHRFDLELPDLECNQLPRRELVGGDVFGKPPPPHAGEDHL